MNRFLIIIITFHFKKYREFNENDYELLLSLDESLQNKKGATEEMIKNLPIYIVTKEEDIKRCCICLCDMEEGTETTKLPCSHYFHQDCIIEWLKINKSCPIDKKNIDAKI